MHLIGHGIDLVECSRIAALLESHGERFLERLLTAAERDYVQRHRDPVPHVAGRFAAKEAVFKVLGTGWRGAIAWRDVEVINDASGRPAIRLHGACAEIASDLGIEGVVISITHTENYAAASAIGLAESSS